MTIVGIYPLAVMKFMNIGVKFKYDTSSMIGSSCCIMRHCMDVKEGNQIVNAWYMRDSIHNFVGTLRTDYAKYDNHSVNFLKNA